MSALTLRDAVAAERRSRELERLVRQHAAVAELAHRPNERAEATRRARDARMRLIRLRLRGVTVARSDAELLGDWIEAEELSDGSLDRLAAVLSNARRTA